VACPKWQDIRSLIFRGGNMKIKNLMISAIVFGLILSLISKTAPAAQKENQKKKTQETPLTIPAAVKAAIQEGSQTRQPRLDIPFSIVKICYLPAQQNMHAIMIFKVKNSDLGFVSAIADTEDQKKKQEKEQEALSIFESSPNKLSTQANVFLQFAKLEDNSPGEIAREVIIPFDLEVDGNIYEPDREEIYTVGCPLPPGDYLLSMAVASPDLEKIGTQYRELALPSTLSFSGTLETTPLFFASSIDTMSAVEPHAAIHKNFFTYSILQIEPNLGNTFTPMDHMELFFYILGAKPNEQGKFDIEINYEVYKGEEIYIRFEPQSYNSPLISQQLPLKRTVLIKSEQGEKRETRDLEAGLYTLSLTITDKISEGVLNKKIDFEVKISLN
jgi:hypothetical protein